MEFEKLDFIFFHGEDGTVRYRNGDKRYEKDLLKEVAKRAEQMREWPTLRALPDSALTGQCDVCGDPMQPHIGGSCWLCIAAWRKVLKSRGAFVSKPRPDVTVSKILLVKRYRKAPWESDEMDPVATACEVCGSKEIKFGAYPSLGAELPSKPPKNFREVILCENCFAEGLPPGWTGRKLDPRDAP